MIELKIAHLMRIKEKKSKACEAVKSGLEDENSKSLKIDENHIEYREKYGAYRNIAILGSEGPGTPLEIILNLNSSGHLPRLPRTSFFGRPRMRSAAEFSQRT